MRGLAALLLVFVAYPAAAQLYRCVDERGRTHYADKVAPGCKPVAGTTTPSAPAPQSVSAKKTPPPPPGAVKPGTKAAKAGPAAPNAKHQPPPKQKQARVAAAPQPKQDRVQLASRCKSMKEEYDWLVGPRGQGVENRSARIDQVKRGMSACP